MVSTGAAQQLVAADPAIESPFECISLLSVSSQVWPHCASRKAAELRPVRQAPEYRNKFKRAERSW